MTRNLTDAAKPTPIHRKLQQEVDLRICEKSTNGGAEYTPNIANPRPFLVYIPYLPPSQNEIWRSGRNAKTGKVMTYRQAGYIRWAGIAGAIIQAAKVAQSWRMAEGLFQLSLFLPAEMRKDEDNLVKATLDTLQACGIVLNDKHARNLQIFRTNQAEGIGIAVRDTAPPTLPIPEWLRKAGASEQKDERLAKLPSATRKKKPLDGFKKTR